MKTSLSREQALEIIKKYNKEPFHILHALTVEGVNALGMLTNWDMVRMRISGVSSDFSMILISNCIQMSIVCARRSF